MSIADKLTTVAENVSKVYNAGYEKGKAEGGGDVTDRYDEGFADGKKAEYDEFWDDFQDNGNRNNYYYTFTQNTTARSWTDKTYNPKYPIICVGQQGASNMFSYNVDITDTKVPIRIEGSTNMAFYSAKNLRTIRTLTFVESTTITNNTFGSCTELVDIEFDGVIANNLNLSWSTKLNAKSIVSAVEHLSSTTSGLTATFSQTAIDNANWSTTDYASWDALIATKTNWTFTKA